MSIGQDEQQSAIDLDSKVAEFGNAIRLNPNDADAYRNRGLVLGRKRDYDRALSDFDKALSLNPNDARAHALRGLVWERKGESKRAIADYDKAIELDPAGAGVYRTHRERVLGDGVATGERTKAGLSARTGGRFNLLLNPFVLLNVEPNATAQTIKQAVEDALEDGIAPADVIQRAQQILLIPRLRVDAEVSGFPDVAPEMSKHIISELKKEVTYGQLSDALNSLHALPRSNVLAHLGSASPMGVSELLQLLETQTIIAADAVFDAVNEARVEAGSGKVDRDAITGALARLEELQTKAVIDTFVENSDFAEVFTTFVKRVLAAKDPALATKLDTYVRAYNQAAAAELSRRREAVIAACDAVREDPKNTETIDRIATTLRHWNEIEQPLQLFEAHMNREEPQARDLYIHVRDLCLWLANEKSEYEAAKTINQACSIVFSNLPRSLGQIQEESEHLTKLLNQQTAMTLLTPLSKVCEEAQQNHRDLETEVIRNGFRATSYGIARTLFDEFAKAVAATRATDNADLPWRLVRDIAISLNNDSKSPKAAAAVINGLVDYFRIQRPSNEMVETLEQDKKTAQKNITQGEFEKSMAAGQMATAATLIDKLLTLETDVNEVASLHKMRDAIAEKRRSSRHKTWGWIAAAAVVLILIAANQDKQPAYSPPAYSPPAYYPPSASTPTIQPQSYPSRPANPPVSPPASLPANPPMAPSEDRPPVGTDLTFTQANIRYCAFQDVRMEEARSLASTEIERAAFNALINDWNSRCSNFRYRPSDKSTVDAEVISRRAALQAEGRAIAGTWQPRQQPRPSPPMATDTAPSFPKAGLAIETRGGQRRFIVEMATTPQQWTWGTSFRASMPADAGMLYLYPEPRRANNSMKTAYFSLDVLFIDQSGQIAEIFERRAPMSVDVVSPKAPARAMLELNAGTVARLGIKVGDTVHTIAANDTTSNAR